jgi:hypothetical protein
MMVGVMNGSQAGLVDSFVGCGENRLRDADTERFRRCAIDGNVKSCELLNGRIGRLHPFEHARPATSASYLGFTTSHAKFFGLGGCAVLG